MDTNENNNSDSKLDELERTVLALAARVTLLDQKLSEVAQAHNTLVSRLDGMLPEFASTVAAQGGAIAAVARHVGIAVETVTGVNREEEE